MCARVCVKAAGQGRLDVIRFLLSNGADPSLVDSGNETARDVAVRFRKLAAVKLLPPDIGQQDFSTVISIFIVVVITVQGVCPGFFIGGGEHNREGPKAESGGGATTHFNQLGGLGAL